MLWLGLLLAAVGGLLVFLSRKSANRVHHMQAVETSRLGELLELVQGIRAELGGGPSEWREHVELKGRVHCDRPVQAELSGQPAAVVQTSIVREFEELREHRDAQGHLTQRWERGSDTVHSNRLEAPFVLDDGTGQVPVRPASADLTLQPVVDRYEQPGAVEIGGAQLRFGGLQVAFGGGHVGGGYGGMHHGLGHQRRTLGYRLQESILPVGARVYALGELSDTGDGLALHKPQAGDKPFVLSVKSEEEMVQAGKSAAKWQKLVGIGLAGLGGVLAVVGLVSMVVG